MVVVLVGQQWRRWPVLPLCSSLSLSCTVLVYHYSQPALPPATYYNFQFKSLKLENLVLLNFDNEASTGRTASLVKLTTQSILE